MSKNIINEAPIPYDELPQSGHYLAGKDKAIIIKREITNDIDAVLNLIKRMSWREITMTGGDNQTVPVLPRPIINAMNAILAGTSPAFSKPVVRDNMSDAQTIAKQLFKDTFVTGSSYCFKGVDGGWSNIYMKIDSSSRTHFPNDGINSKLRGTGLGKKLYRSLIERKTWVQTNSGGSEIKNWMWASLTHEQFDEQGNRDRDAEIYSFRINNALYAVSTTRRDCIDGGYTIINNIDNKSVLASKELRVANNIGIDADFIALCREKASSNAKAQQIIDWMEPSPEALARLNAERERAERERVERERTENERRSAGLRDRLMAYCGVDNINDLSDSWSPGDWIVLKQYLLDNTYSNLPVRKVSINSDSSQYIAYSPSSPSSDGRSLAVNAGKSAWVKALPPAEGYDYPPGINRVPANAPRRNDTSSTQPAQTRLSDTTSTGNQINNFVEVERVISASYNITDNAASDTNTYRGTPRQQKTYTTKALNFGIYLPNPLLLTQSLKFQNRPFFGYIIDNRDMFINSKTCVVSGGLVNDPAKDFIVNNSTKYDLRRVIEKTELSAGDLVYIGSHSKFYGYIAKVIRTALTARGDKYVYLSVPGAGRNNRLTLTPRALYKLERATNENVNTDIPFITSLNEFKKYM